MRYLIDTDWVIDAFMGIRTAQRALDDLSAEGIGVSIVTYGEIFEGAFGDPDHRRGWHFFATTSRRFTLFH